jgi:hypothetical protein
MTNWLDTPLMRPNSAETKVQELPHVPLSARQRLKLSDKPHNNDTTRYANPRDPATQ